jgi:hypothetical protein
LRKLRWKLSSQVSRRALLATRQRQSYRPEADRGKSASVLGRASVSMHPGRRSCLTVALVVFRFDSNSWLAYEAIANFRAMELTLAQNKTLRIDAVARILIADNLRDGHILFHSTIGNRHLHFGF